jgi:hypothetical protein
MKVKIFCGKLTKRNDTLEEKCQSQNWLADWMDQRLGNLRILV